jgi:hypothetical protein
MFHLSYLSYLLILLSYPFFLLSYPFNKGVSLWAGLSALAFSRRKPAQKELKQKCANP